jgi:Tol biopolymer transport system component
VVIIGSLNRPWLLPLIAIVAAALAGCGESDDRPHLVVYEASTGGVTNIFTIDPTTGETAQLTDADDFDGNPSWSPDRKHIVFSSKRDDPEAFDLYVMDADGGNVRRLTETPDAGELSPRYSPDGKRIAYVSDDGDSWTVWEMSAAGDDKRRLAGSYDFAEFPAWTPDGRLLYFAAIEEAAANAAGSSAVDIYATSSENTAHIYSVDLRTLEVQTRIRTAGIDVCPHISPDGERLVYASTSTADSATHRIFSHDLDSGDTTGASDTPLTDGSARSDYPDPSPDGSRLVFTSERDGNTEMYIMNADGTEQRRLTHTPEMRENVPDW